jgi:hypothetical protein
MPKINVEIAEQLPEPQEGHTYTITSAELFTSTVRAYKGLRVNLEEADGTKVVAPLWMREIAGEKSKLGSFVKCLGDDTDKWVGHKIKFVAWRQNNREINQV